MTFRLLRYIGRSLCLHIVAKPIAIGDTFALLRLVSLIISIFYFNNQLYMVLTKSFAKR